MKKLPVIMLAASLVLSAIPARAQTVVLPDEEPRVQTKKNPVLVLNKRQLELTLDYLDLLEQVNHLTEDYSKYLKKYSDQSAQEYLKAIMEFRTQMAEAEQLTKVAQLRQQIHDLQDKLQSKSSVDRSREAARAHKLAHTLSRELKSVDELIGVELDDELSMGNEETNQLRECLVAMVEKAKDNYKVTSARYGDENTCTVVVRVPGSDDDEVTISIPYVVVTPEYGYVTVPAPSAIPSVPDIETEVPPPAPPRITVSNRDIIYHQGRGGNVSIVKTFVDSSANISPTTLIKVLNPIGNLEINGWDRKYVKAQSELTVVAADLTKSMNIAEGLNLHIYVQDNILFVSPEIPRISDPSSQIADNSVVVYVPRTNKVVSQSSFGKFKVADLNNDLTLSSENSSIFLSDIQGGITAKNSNGPISIQDSRGSMNIKNSTGIISLTDCEGTIELHNSFSSTKLRDCGGELTIRGEGQVDISDHKGTVNIDNSNGLVRVVRSEGDVTVVNANGPSIVAFVSGSANIESKNAGIQAEGIAGSLSIKNSFASINVAGIGGPFQLSNEHGDIRLVLSEPIGGNSLIESNSGLVNIKLLDKQNLVLNVSAIGGEIDSRLPFDLVTTGKNKTLKHVFGKGKSELVVTSQSGTVEISDDR